MSIQQQWHHSCDWCGDWSSEDTPAFKKDWRYVIVRKQIQYVCPGCQVMAEEEHPGKYTFKDPGK